jgi:hypothetical protein
MDGSRTNEAENVPERVADLTDPSAVLNCEWTPEEGGARARERLDSRVEGLHPAVSHCTARTRACLGVRGMEAKMDVASHDGGQPCPVNLPIDNLPIPGHCFLYVLDEEDNAFDRSKHNRRYVTSLLDARLCVSATWVLPAPGAGTSVPKSGIGDRVGPGRSKG